MSADIIRMPTAEIIRRPVSGDSDERLNEKLIVGNLYEAAKRMLDLHACDAACVECILLRKAIELVERYYLNREK